MPRKQSARNSGQGHYTPWSVEELKRWVSDVELNHRVKLRFVLTDGVRPSEWRCAGQAYRIEDGKVRVLCERYTILPSRLTPNWEAAVLYLANQLDSGLTWDSATAASGLERKT